MGFWRFIQVNGKDYNESPFSKSPNWTKRAYLKHSQLRDKGNSLLLKSVETLDLLPFQCGVGRHFCSKSIAETTQWGSTPSPPSPQNLILGVSICGTCVVLLFGENLIYIKQLLDHSSGTSMDHDLRPSSSIMRGCAAMLRSGWDQHTRRQKYPSFAQIWWKAFT
jgi:hypothetical protein